MLAIPHFTACEGYEAGVTALSTAKGTLTLVSFRDTYSRLALCKAIYVQDDGGFPIKMI